MLTLFVFDNGLVCSRLCITNCLLHKPCPHTARLIGKLGSANPDLKGSTWRAGPVLINSDSWIRKRGGC